MAEPHAELQAKLQELDHELEEGDITRKGSVSPLPLPLPLPHPHPPRALTTHIVSA